MNDTWITDRKFDFYSHRVIILIVLGQIKELLHFGHMAQQRGYTEIVALLKKHGAKE